MSEFCSCGAQLPPDAVFCHKCGKPQREIVVPEIEIEAPAEPPPLAQAPPPPPAPLDFHNRVAVRIAMLVAIGATVLSISIPFVSWAAAGFVAVFFYKRKTGSLLNVGAGVRMGWITGLLMYALWAVVFVAAALTGKFSALLHENMGNMAGQDPLVRQMMMNILQSGSGLFAIFVLTLAACFFFITGLSIAGGALGAKVVGGD
jgi:zinc ribbon protein